MSALYDRIGVGYNDTRAADPTITARLALLLQPRDARRYLDLACGTGNYTLALAERGGAWTGIDESQHMVAAARARGDLAHFQVGAAVPLPFADASFDGVVSTLAIHHFPDRLSAFREVRRVLGTGPFVLFVAELNRTMSFWLRHYFPAMFERIAEKEPSQQEMLRELGDAGFEEIETAPYWVDDTLRDHFLYSGKQRPELYFEPAIRAGISTFANLATPAQIEEGLAQLRGDLDAGSFESVAGAHPSPEGDYLFIRAS